MLIAWVGVLVPLLILTGVFRSYFRFVFTILFPIAIALILVWSWIVGAPPGFAPASSPYEGTRFAILVTIRLALIGGISQLCLLSIPPNRLASTLKYWGIKGEGLIVALGCFALLPELKIRAGQVLTARYARGLVPNRSFCTRFRQVPYLFRPLLIWVLRSAIQRSEIWQQRQLVTRIQVDSPEDDKGSVIINLLYLTFAISWLIYNMFQRSHI